MKMRHFRLALIILMSIATLSCGRLGERVEKKIESAGSELTGVPVQVERVELKLARGMGEIAGLTVANPAGYEAEYAFQMDLSRLNLGVLSLLLGVKTIILDELVIDSPVVNFERNAQGGSNLKEISDNVRKNLDRADQKLVEEKPTTDKSPKEPIRIAVRKLVIRGVTFNARRVDGTTASGTLPDIELTDVGGSEGMTAGGLGSVVVAAMAREMFKHVAAQRLTKSGSRIHLALETIDAERILETLNQKLALTIEQIEKAKPIIEQLSQNLKNVIRQIQEHGFLELESLSKRFEALAGEVQARLQDILTDAQLQKLKTLLNKLNDNTIETIWTAMVDELMKFLEPKKDQIERLRSILREELQKRYELLSHFKKTPGKSFDDFKSAYQALQNETLQRLSDTLDTAQIKALKDRQAKLREIIQAVYFGVFEP
jgi:hypothetical protein